MNASEHLPTLIANPDAHMKRQATTAARRAWGGGPFLSRWKSCPRKSAPRGPTKLRSNQAESLKQDVRNNKIMSATAKHPHRQPHQGTTGNLTTRHFAFTGTNSVYPTREIASIPPLHVQGVYLNPKKTMTKIRLVSESRLCVLAWWKHLAAAFPLT